MAKKKDEIEMPDEPLIENEVVEDGLVKVHRKGKFLHVHPTCVAAHEKAGWEVVD